MTPRGGSRRCAATDDHVCPESPLPAGGHSSARTVSGAGQWVVGWTGRDGRVLKSNGAGGRRVNCSAADAPVAVVARGWSTVRRRRR